jgi:hypothetical protein
MCASKFGTNRNTLYTRVLAIVRRDARQLLVYGTIATCRPDWNGASRSLGLCRLWQPVATVETHIRAMMLTLALDVALVAAVGAGLVWALA